jgi:hypothetical protein
MTKQLPRPFIPKPLKHSITLNLGAGGTKLKIMKKLFTMMAICLGAFTAANAQYTPEKGDFAVEFGFTPFNTENGESFKLNEKMLKARYFISNKDALRLKLGLDFSNRTTTETTTVDESALEISPYEISNTTSKTKEKFSSFSIMLGYERHLFTKGRFDVYAGLELGYLMNKYSGTETEESEGSYFDEKGQLQGTFKENNEYSYTNRSVEVDLAGDPINKTTNNFVATLFAGVDFYVYKQLYLGAEFGLRFKTGKTPNYYESWDLFEASYKANGTLNKSVTENWDGETQSGQRITADASSSKTDKLGTGTSKSNETTETSFKLNIEPAIRIGWTF